MRLPEWLKARSFIHGFRSPLVNLLQNPKTKNTGFSLPPNSELYEDQNPKPYTMTTAVSSFLSVCIVVLVPVPRFQQIYETSFSVNAKYEDPYYPSWRFIGLSQYSYKYLNWVTFFIILATKSHEPSLG